MTFSYTGTGLGATPEQIQQAEQSLAAQSGTRYAPRTQDDYNRQFEQYLQGIVDPAGASQRHGTIFSSLVDPVLKTVSPIATAAAKYVANPFVIGSLGSLGMAGVLGGAGGAAGAATTTPYIAPGGSITGSALGAGAGAGAAGGAAGAAGAGMGSSWLNWLNLGNSILGAVGANSAAKAQEKGADAAIAESRRQFDIARGDLLPVIGLGGDAATQLDSINSGAPINPASLPGYEFNLGQGQQAIDRKLSSLGLNNSGGAVKEGARFATGLADSNFGDYYNRLLASAGLGTSGASTSANAGANSAALVGNASQASGNARASGYANMYGALQGGIQNDLLMRYLNQKGP